MNDLPPELWTIIFKRLDFPDQNNCQLVCSRWKAIVDSIKVKDLMICDSDWALPYSWFITNEPISFNNILLNSELSTSLQLPSRFYESVRRLKLYSECVDTIHLKWVEKFDELRQLEINWINELENLLISLPNLNKLYINYLNIPNAKKSGTEFLVFNAPKLQFAHFGTDISRAVRLIHFDCLEYLEFEDDGGYSDLNHFRNLKIVHCNSVTKISFNLMRSLIRLPKLAELHINSLDLTPDCYAPPSEKQINRLRTRFDYYSNKIKASKKLNFKLYFQGVLVEGDQAFDEYDFDQSPLSLQMEHYDSLADCIQWYKKIDFEELVESTGCEIPINFTQKYPNIKYVYVGENVEEDKLIWFLRGCRNLVNLEIETSLTQQFYDQLADWNCGLRELVIRHHNAEINFEFLFKLEFLFRFVTTCPLSMEIALDLMSRVKYCKIIEYSFRSDRVMIRKIGKNDFKIEVGSKYKATYQQL